MNNLSNIRLITAVKTPYKIDGSIDLTTYDKLVNRQIENGIEGIVVGGTTGEGHLMSWDEHLMLIAHSVQQFGNQIAIIGNTGSNYTKEAINATTHGFAVGMHAALQINPYYGKTSKNGLRAHFQKVLDIGPTIIYNVPSRTAQDISPILIKEFVQHEHFLGVKECQGPDRIANYTDEGIVCWSGNDDDCLESITQSGATGVISVTSNIVPKAMRELLDKKSTKLSHKLHSFISWLFCEPNPIGLNTILAMMGLTKPVFRLPYFPLDIESRKSGLKLLEEIGDSYLLGIDLQLLKDDSFIIV